MRVGKRVAIGVGIIVAGIMLALLGSLGKVRSHYDGACSTVPLAGNVADISIDPARGLAYLAYVESHGTIMLVDLNVAKPRPRAALTIEPPEFHPVALSLHVPATGPRRLFVINRAENGSSAIDIFEQSSTGAFDLAQTVRDPKLVSAAAIVAIGPRAFYVANDSNVVHYDGTRVIEVSAGLREATGIGISADGRTIYVAEAGREQLRIFNRDIDDGSLQSREVVTLGSPPDKLTVADDGSVWVTGEPSRITAFLHSRNPKKQAPTQVLKITPGAAADARVSEIYADAGGQLSAGSVAARHGSRLLIGSATDRKLLLCAPK